MRTKGFGMGFFGRNFFDKEARKEFKEKWERMTDSEKLELINKRMEHFDKDEDFFSVEAIDSRCEKWMKMTQEEKTAFVEEKKAAIQNRMNGMGGFFNFMNR